jgi:hypothetical protein
VLFVGESPPLAARSATAPTPRSTTPRARRNQTTDAGSFEEFTAQPPVGDPPFDLGRGLSIAELDYDLVELVMNACSQRGHYFVATRQLGCRYAFVLEQRPQSVPSFDWDPDGMISQAVALSRLMRDNTYSTEYAARVVEHEDGELQVIPHDDVESRYAYRLGDERNWLDAEDGTQLRALLAAWASPRDDLTARLRRALWRAEHLSWERYLDIALPGFVAALEGLISTGSRQVTRQFVTPVPLLARDLGVPGVSKSFCKAMYNARSQGFHGADIDPSGKRSMTSQSPRRPGSRPCCVRRFAGPLRTRTSGRSSTMTTPSAEDGQSMCGLGASGADWGGARRSSQPPTSSVARTRVAIGGLS